MHVLSTYAHGFKLFKYIQVSLIMHVQAQQYCVYLKMATLCKYHIFFTEWVLTFGKKRILFIQEKSCAHHQFAHLETSNYLHRWDHCACLCDQFSSWYCLQFTKCVTSSNTHHNYAHWMHSSYKLIFLLAWAPITTYLYGMPSLAKVLFFLDNWDIGGYRSQTFFRSLITRLSGI